MLRFEIHHSNYLHAWNFQGLLWSTKTMRGKKWCEAGVFVPQLEKNTTLCFPENYINFGKIWLWPLHPRKFPKLQNGHFWVNGHITQPTLPLHCKAAPCLVKYLLISLTKTRATLSGKNDTYQVFKAIGLFGCLWCIFQPSIIIYHFMEELKQLLWAQSSSREQSSFVC